MLVDAGGAPLEGEARVILEQAPCDVALLVRRAPLRDGPVLVPFGAGRHDWAALELGALGRARDRRAAAADRRRLRRAADGRDASRLLADASLIVQRHGGRRRRAGAGPPGRRGVVAQAEAPGCSSSASPTAGARRVSAACATRSSRDPPAPTVFVRRGSASGGLTPADPGRASAGR